MFMMIGIVLVCMFLPFSPLKTRKNEADFSWSLGVDCCCYYSKPFTISNHRITIKGYHEVLGEEKAICYSLVKKNWWGKRTVIGQIHIPREDNHPNRFQFTFNQIPNGLNYQIEVLNGFNIAYGHFKVVEG